MLNRTWAGRDGVKEPPRRASADGLTLPSRGDAIEFLRLALESQAGPVLLTGEAGVGKTWLCRRLQDAMPRPGRWTVVDVPPAIEPDRLYHLIGHALGLAVRGVAEEARLSLAEALREAVLDGVRWTLVLDEAQNAPPAVLEEVRILANRLGQPDGFSGLLLVGQSALACRLSTRPMKALAARLAAHVHLRCLDVEEARALLDGLMPSLDWDDRTLERYHRDAGGNPSRMLMTAQAMASATARPRRLRDRTLTESARPNDRPRPVLAPVAPAPPDDRWESPAVGPIKPPLRIGDGMIEVGWEPDLESETEPRPEPVAEPESEAASTPSARETGDERPGNTTEIETETGGAPAAEVIESIDDHYAALQAWNEWSRNRQRGASPVACDGPFATDPSNHALSGAEGDRFRSPAGASSVWVDDQQEFAPYGQLFSRLRHISDADGPGS